MARGWNPTRSSDTVRIREKDTAVEALEYINSAIEALMPAVSDYKYMVIKLEKSRLRGTEIEERVRKVYQRLVGQFNQLKRARKELEKEIQNTPAWIAAEKRLLDYQNSLVPDDVIEDGKKARPEQDLKDIFG